MACKIVEEYAQEYAQELAEENIRIALKKNKKPEDIADFLNVSIKQVLRIKEEMEL